MLKSFSSHLFRKRGDTWAFLSGVPSELIKLMGDWSSDYYLRKIQFPTEASAAASDLVRIQLQWLGL